MKMYRIIQLIHGASRYPHDSKVEYVIEKRGGFLLKRWKEIRLIENGIHRRISHKTYIDAEDHLMNTYTNGYGIGSMVTKTGNVYYVEPYTMNFC